ncbi:hypothetical protein BH23BAC1_BH23BAC1_26850 [soil metagenome]
MFDRVPLHDSAQGSAIPLGFTEQLQSGAY